MSSEETNGAAPEGAARDAVAEGEETPSKPQHKKFRSRFNAVRLAPDQAERQGRAARLAWEALGDRDAMVAFLNTHDDALGGRPIDLAVASEDGLAAVVAALAARKAG